MTDTLPSVSTLGNFFTMAFRLAMRNTPKANVTVTTIGNPSGIAATARDTVYLSVSIPAVEASELRRLTANCEHFQPTPMLKYTDEANHTDDSEGNDRKSFCEFIHRQLKWSFPITDLSIEVCVS